MFQFPLFFKQYGIRVVVLPPAIVISVIPIIN